MELKRMRIGKLLGLAVALAILVLALVAGNQGGVGLGQAQEEPCTVTLTPDQSIQEEIDKANPGDVICLSEGEWEENLVIRKSLTLRGAGRERSVIKGKEKGLPVIQIESDSEIEVTIEGLTIAEAKVGGNWPWVASGIQIGGKAKVIVRNSQISWNDFGIFMWGSSQAEISGSTIAGNDKDGIRMVDSSQATISGSQILGNGDGITMLDSSQAKILDNKIFENAGYGVALYQSPCYYTDKKFEGKVEGSGNEIHDNGRRNVCPSRLVFLMTSQGGCFGPKC